MDPAPPSGPTYKDQWSPFPPPCLWKINKSCWLAANLFTPEGPRDGDSSIGPQAAVARLLVHFLPSTVVAYCLPRGPGSTTSIGTPSMLLLPWLPPFPRPIAVDGVERNCFTMHRTVLIIDLLYMVYHNRCSLSKGRPHGRRQLVATYVSAAAGKADIGFGSLHGSWTRQIPTLTCVDW